MQDDVSICRKQKLCYFAGRSQGCFFDMLIPKTHPEMSCVSFHLQLVIQLTLERV